MNEIRFEISTEDLIEELQDDCKELERELVKPGLCIRKSA